MEEFSMEVIHIIQSIPKGKVMTYGQIASICGNPHGARQVSRILHSSSKKYNLPWFRVVNSKGMISLQGEGKFIQLEKLSEEGVYFHNDKLDFDTYLYKPYKEIKQ